MVKNYSVCIFTLNMRILSHIPTYPHRIDLSKEIIYQKMHIKDTNIYKDSLVHIWHNINSCL